MSASRRPPSKPDRRGPVPTPGPADRPPPARLTIDIGSAPPPAHAPTAPVDPALVDLARRLGATTMFSPLPRDRLAALLARSSHRSASAGDWLADRSTGLQDHLVLLSGEAEVLRRWVGPDGGERTHRRYVRVAADGPGFALISAAGPRLEVRAATDLACVAIDSDDLDDLLGWTHLGAFVLPEPHLRLFHRLPLENVAGAIRCLVERRVAAGETIVSQGEPGDAHYTLLSGEAEVFERDPATGQPVLVNRLTDGDSFGEEALLTDTPRTATVTMCTPGELLVLSRTDFDRLVRRPMVEVIDAASAQREIAAGTARLLDCRAPDEFAEGHIAGAMSMPLDRLRHGGVFEIDLEARHIVCCRNGRRGRAAAFLLQERGIRACSLEGGLAAWPYGLTDAAS